MSDDGHDPELRIGEYASGFALEEVPRPVRERAKLVLLDTVGVCIRGAKTAHVTRTPGQLAAFGIASPGGGQSTVFASGDRRSPVVAALVNAAGGTTLELDEGNQRSGHMGIHVVPPALAYAEAVGASGIDLLSAIIVAYETCARVGALVRPMQPGLHPHGAWTPVGAAIAAGRLHEFDAAAFADAVRLAVNPYVVGHWAAATEGATVRDYYPGLACSHGIHAAALAAAGVTGVHHAIRRCLLPYTSARAAGDDAITEMLGTLGESYFLERSYFKMHAACRYTHAPLEALKELSQEHDIRPETVERLTVRTFELGASLDETTPRNPLAAKFSTPYALAALIVTGTSGVDAFVEQRVRDPEIRELADRVEIVASPSFERGAETGDWGASVEVELSDGTTVERTIDNARGGGDDPYTRAEIIAKFETLVGDTEPRSTVDRLREGLLEIEDVDDAGSVLEPFG